MIFNPSLESNISSLFDVAVNLLEDGLECSGDLARMIKATKIDPVGLAPNRLAACRHWQPALDLASPESRPLAAALAPLYDALHWVQNPNYTANSMGAEYMDHYAYANIVGSRSLLGGDDYAMGMLLLGPGLLYPPHAHPASELYYVVGGRAHWRRDGGDWTAREPGSLIHHPPAMIHATRTGGEPLLAFYMWWGDINTHAALVDGA